MRVSFREVRSHDAGMTAKLDVLLSSRVNYERRVTQVVRQRGGARRRKTRAEPQLVICDFNIPSPWGPGQDAITTAFRIANKASKALQTSSHRQRRKTDAKNLTYSSVNSYSLVSVS